MVVGKVLSLDARREPSVRQFVARPGGRGLYFGGGTLRVLIRVGAVARNRGGKRDRDRGVSQLSCTHCSSPHQDGCKERPVSLIRQTGLPRVLSRNTTVASGTGQTFGKLPIL